MPRFLTAIAFTAAAMAVSTAPARAQDLSTTSSSGTMTVSLYIPPIAPALAASRDGAVGLWTIEGRFGGLMLRVGDAGTQDVVTLYTRPGNLVAVAAGMSAWSSQSLIPAASVVNRGGLLTESYNQGSLRNAQGVTLIGL